MIALAEDKQALVKMIYSMYDLLVPIHSTLHQISEPGGFTFHRKRPPPTVATGQDNT
jgi:hypothetical protein